MTSKATAEPKGGITTGCCAALAAKAAAIAYFMDSIPKTVEVPLPDGSRLAWPIASVTSTDDGVEASVIKDAGDDPDVTHGARIRVFITPNKGTEIVFRAGSGVGTVTLPGLALAVGEAAINPVPRAMITAAVREVTAHGISVTVAVDGGQQLAEKTFNPKLGIRGGISIIGTSGRVRPFSAPALQESLKCALDICIASKISAPVFVPGNMGRNAAQREFNLGAQQIVEVSNEWGYMLKQAQGQPFTTVLMMGHPGKLAKLAMQQWNTHSAHSNSAVPFVAQLAKHLTQRCLTETTTVEALFMQQLTSAERPQVANQLAVEIQQMTAQNFPATWYPSVVLINLKGEIIGSAGDLQSWRRIPPEDKP
ncbi:MAG: cobalt-precorrin-5B (C(1))-methyltransferase CbiD [Desulfuromonas sp.]|nr:cobalt-precorrin-5B (C(1))-methyltransferase CbiD [Desulfuromonas sp.]